MTKSTFLSPSRLLTSWYFPGGYEEMSSSWPIAPLVCGGRGGIAGSRPMSTAVHIKWHGAQINFGYLTPYLTYAICSIGLFSGPRRARAPPPAPPPQPPFPGAPHPPLLWTWAAAAGRPGRPFNRRPHPRPSRPGRRFNRRAHPRPRPRPPRSVLAPASEKHSLHHYRSSFFFFCIFLLTASSVVLATPLLMTPIL